MYSWTCLSILILQKYLETTILAKKEIVSKLAHIDTHFRNIVPHKVIKEHQFLHKIDKISQILSESYSNITTFIIQILSVNRYENSLIQCVINFRQTFIHRGGNHKNLLWKHVCGRYFPANENIHEQYQITTS